MKILIIRLSSMGDIIMAMGILPALKRKFPEAEIHWMVQSEFKELVKNNALIKKTISWDRKNWKLLLKRKHFFSLYRELSYLIHTIRENHYDMVLDLQGIWKSALWSLSARTHKRIIVEPKEKTNLFFKERIIPPREEKILGSEYKELLKYLGAPIEDYYLPLTSNSCTTPLEKKDYIVLCPFTTRKQKHWIEKFWREVVTSLLDLNISLIVLGGPADKERSTRLFSPFKKKITLLVGKTTIIEAMGIIRKAQGVIGVDTGLTHAAMLYHIPTVAIFGATCPYLYPDHPKGIVLYSPLKCSPCKRNPTCGGKFTCMKNITPSMVLKAIEAISLKSLYSPPLQDKA